jgi:TPR repeat protein
MALDITSLTSLLSHWSAPRVRALFAQDASHAAPWVFALAREGLAPAQLCYGRMLLAGTGAPSDQVAALHWFRCAAASGDNEAINMVGRCLDNGWGTKADPVAAAAQ